MVLLSSGFNPSALTHPLPSLAGKVGMGGVPENLLGGCVVQLVHPCG